MLIRLIYLILLVAGFPLVLLAKKWSMKHEIEDAIKTIAPVIAIVAFVLATIANCRIDAVCRDLGAVNCKYLSDVRWR